MDQDTKPAPEQQPAEPVQAAAAAPAATDAAAHTEVQPAPEKRAVAPVAPPAPAQAANPFEPTVANEQPAQVPEAKPEPAAPPAPTVDHELAARIAKLEEAEKANAARLQAQAEAARRMVLEGLRVKEKYRHLAPQDADPFTDEGKRALEVWARENAELCEVVPAEQSEGARMVTAAKDKPGRWMIDEAAIDAGLRDIERRFGGRGFIQ